MNSQLEDRLESSEVERQRVNDKWLKLVARHRVDEKNTRREKEGEQKKELVTKELEMIKKKNEFYERENKYLREQMLEIQGKLAAKMERINDEKKLKEEVEVLRNKEVEQEREITKITRKYHDLILENQQKQIEINHIKELEKD